MNDTPVYSAGPAPVPACPRCGRTPCACPRPLAAPKQKGPVTLRIDRGGRRGKTVTRVEDLPTHPQGKIDLLKKFQKMCGAGGTLKQGVVEIQGDHRARLKGALEALGYKVRVIG